MADERKEGIKEESVKEKPGEKRKKLIADLTLQGKFWGNSGALRLEEEFLMICKTSALAFADPEKLRISSLAPKIPAEFFSAISSTYYAASGNALSHIKQANLFSKLLWYWRAWRCLRKAEKYSDNFARKISLQIMSLGELDVRACILNKTGRQKEALSVVSHGIMKILTWQLGSKHDLCLFLIHEAEIITGMRKYDKENKAEKNYRQAMELTEDETVPTLTKVRVMKSYGNFLAKNKRIDEAESVLGDALDLARENKFYDQERKIKATFKTFKLVIR